MAKNFNNLFINLININKKIILNYLKKIIVYLFNN